MKNRILTNKDRKELESLIKKVSDVQDAFVVDFIYPKFKEKEILCINTSKDKAFKYLKSLDVNVINIEVDKLNSFKVHTTLDFDIIFSISIIEHIENDEQFIRDICELLKGGGFGILTTDFFENFSMVDNVTDQFLTANGIKNGIRMGREKRMELRRLQDAQKLLSVKRPEGNVRLYTSNDYKRIAKILEEYDCFFVDEFEVDAEPDIELDNCKYSLSTMVFRKLR
jgi:SAM-dependent methyltransferase